MNTCKKSGYVISA